MKKFILACGLLAGTCTLSMAQSATATSSPKAAVTAENPQLTFSSKVNEFEAHVMRNNLDAAQKMAGELMGLMQQNISKNLKNLGSSKVAEVQTEIAKRIQHENELYADFKVMSADLNKNKTEMVSKAKAFLQDF